MMILSNFDLHHNEDILHDNDEEEEEEAAAVEVHFSPDWVER
jgi:hypothetical protein